jgi:hypothetical protein
MFSLLIALSLVGQISGLGRSIQSGINNADYSPEKRLPCDIPIPAIDVSKLEGTKETEPYLAACAKERELQIQTEQNNLTRMLNNRRSDRGSIQRLRERLLQLESSPPLAFVPKLRAPLEVGKVGAPMRIDVAQVIDDKNMHAELLLDTGAAPITVRVNLEANGAIDGERVRPFPMEITGTKKYITTNGAVATIYTAKPVNLAPIKELTDKAIVAARTREWKSGKYSVVAEFVKLEKFTVTLKKEDGSEIDVPLNKLSRECQSAAREFAGK